MENGFTRGMLYMVNWRILPDAATISVPPILSPELRLNLQFQGEEWMSKSSDFISMCMNGEARLEDIEEFIQGWHEHPSGLSLHDYLGMTWKEYSLWVADPDILPHIITAHLIERKP